MKIKLTTDVISSRPGELLKGKAGQVVDWPTDIAQGLVADKRAEKVEQPKTTKKPKPAKK